MDETRTINYRGCKFMFYSTPTLNYLIREIFNDNYHVIQNVDSGNLSFSPGDVILDLGANEGIFSIFMARMFPQVRVVALEPISRTFYQMIRNIGLNGVANIDAYNFGVGGEEKLVNFNVHKSYSGGSSTVDTFDPVNHNQVQGEIYTLAQIIRRTRIDGPIKLLKIDIEGMEHEALGTKEAKVILGAAVDNVVGEIHINERLKRMGYSIEGTANAIAKETRLLYFDACKMGE